MRLAIFSLALLGLLVSGCQVIPTDMVPKVKWYWSKDAIQYRQDRDNGNPRKHE